MVIRITNTIYKTRSNDEIIIKEQFSNLEERYPPTSITYIGMGAANLSLAYLLTGQDFEEIILFSQEGQLAYQDIDEKGFI